MAGDWSVLPSVISALSGLCGVWLGGQLTSKREAVREAERIRKESSYLAILVVAHLDRFVNGCLEVSFDDGTSEGRPSGEDGRHQATTTAPSFDPLALSVDWKVLPAELMYGVLNIPYKTEKLQSHISGVWEFADPPDYTDAFWARQHGYATLGLEVSALAKLLRKHADLPAETPAIGDWDRDDALRAQAAKIEKARADYEARAIKKQLPIPGPPVL